MIALASLSLSSCSQPASINQNKPLQTDHISDGQIFDLHRNKTITKQELLAELAVARQLIIGEKHDNAGHHQIELWLVQNLPTWRPQGSVLLEMLTADQQPRVNQVKRWLKDDPVVRDGRVQELLSWQKGWSWEMYDDIVIQALRAPYPLLNANIDRDRVMELYKKTNFLKVKNPQHLRYKELCAKPS